MTKQWKELHEYVVRQMISRPKKETEAYKMILKEMEQLEEKYKRIRNPYYDYDPEASLVSH